ncbi:MAG: hypothetical protein H7839_13055 [Magnetococcus sp. YQC-5]
MNNLRQFLIPLLVAAPALLVLLGTFHSASKQLEEGAAANLVNVGHKILEKTESFLDQAAYSADFNASWIAANLGSASFVQDFYATAHKEKSYFPHFGLIYYGDEQGNQWMYKQDPDGVSRIRIIERLEDSPASQEALDKAASMPKEDAAQKERVAQGIAPYLKTSWQAPDKEGILQFDSLDPIKIYDPRQRPWYIGAKKKQGKFWTDVYTWEENFKGAITRQIGATIAIPVMRQGRLTGIVAIDLVLQSISEFLANLMISPHGRAFIVDAHGLLVGMPNYREMLQLSSDGKGMIRQVHMDEVKDQAMVAAHAALRKHLNIPHGKPLEPFDNKIVYFTAQQEKFIGFFKSLSSSYHLNWHVGVIMPEDDIKGPLKKKFTWILGAIVAVVILFLCIIPFYMKSEKERRFITSAFSKYISPNRVAFLLENPEHLSLGGEFRECSFVMTDLAGFTSLMEQIGENSDPAIIVNILNEYLEGMVQIAFKHEGTLDRIVGDAVAVLFSAPVSQKDHAQRALACALEMDQFASEFSRARHKEGMPFGNTRIGVNSGRVLLGNFGGKTVFDYRALGDPINTAARLETVNGQLGTRICVSGETVAHLPDFKGRLIGTLMLKGKGIGVVAYEPLTPEEYASLRIQAYQEAYRLMVEENPEAHTAFAKALEQWPEDPLLRFHEERLRNGGHGEQIYFARK